MKNSFFRSAGVLCLSIGVTGSVFARSTDKDINLPNLQKTNDHLYRGGQPTADGFATLAKMGVKTVIDLREIGEHSQADEQKTVNGLGMKYVSIPFKGMSAPSEKQISSVMAILEDTNNGPVFVHCRRGADRTGTVMAVYRIRNDHWDNAKALAEAKTYGMAWLERSMQSYVKHYKSDVVSAQAAPATLQPALEAAVGTN